MISACPRTRMLRFGQGHLALGLLSLVLLLQSCGSRESGTKLKAVSPNDSGTKLVRVNDTTVTPPVKRLMLVTGGRGYYVETNGSSNCGTLTGFGFVSPDLNSLPTWADTSAEVIAAKPALQPTLQCYSDPAQQAAQIKGLRVIAEAGHAPRYFYLFPGTAQKNKYYELGCKELLPAFSWLDTAALPITTTTLADADQVADLNCRAGNAFPVPTTRPTAGSFQDWCTRTNLDDGERYTMDILLNKSGKTSCADAEAELRKPTFTNLDLSGQSIDAVGPLESLQWIRSLDLTGNNLTDISGLGKLTRLTTLKLKNNGITDIQPLSQLTNLKTLDLESNDISSVAPLRNLRFLDSVNVKFNARLRPMASTNSFFESCVLKTSMLPAAARAVDAVLERVSTNRCWQAADLLETTVDTLDFSGMMPPIEDVSALASLHNTHVTNINLANHTFTDARPLASLPALTSLNLDGTNIDTEKCPFESGSEVLQDFCHTRSQTFMYWCRNPQVSATANITVTAIRTDASMPTSTCAEVYAAVKNGMSRSPETTGSLSLYVSNWPDRISDLRPLRGLSGVRRLFVFNSTVADLSVLRYMPQLQEISVDGGAVGSLAPLSGSRTLRRLTIYSSAVSDLSPLSGIRTLEDLNLPSSNISNLAPLRTLTSLRSLNLSGNPLTSIAELAPLTQLENLFINTTTVSDITAVLGMTRLKMLGLYQTRVTSLAPLRNASALESLGTDGSPIESLDGLQSKPNLTDLKVKGGNVVDLSPLAASTRMKTLYLEEVTLNSLATLASMNKLTDLRISSKQIGSTGNTVLDLTPLHNMQELEILYITSYRLPNLFPLSGLNKMSILVLNLDAITDVTAIAGIPNLSYLSVNFNSIHSFVPLSNMQNMNDLSATGSGVDPRNISVCPNRTNNWALNAYCSAAR